MGNSAIDSMGKIVEELPVISNHEHHLPDHLQVEMSLDRILDFSYIGWFAGRDNIQLADSPKDDPLLPNRIHKKKYPLPGKSPSGDQKSILQEREKFLDRFGYNSYWVWLEKGIKKVYGIQDGINPTNWGQISSLITEKHKAPTFHIDVMKDHGKYLRAVQDTYWDYSSDLGHPDFFSPTMRIDMFITSNHISVLDHDLNNPFIEYPNAPKTNFDDYLDFLTDLFHVWRNNGAVAMKCASAYERPIRFNKYKRQDVKGIFNKPGEALSQEDRIMYGDFMFHWFCDLNRELEISFQIHTGLAEISGSNPMHFEPIIKSYPDIQFVLFHSGYPWYHETAGLAHNYENVFIDMVWAPLISTSASIQALREYIEVARTSDSIGWGGDTWTSEEAVGAVLAWKYVVSKVLAEMVESNYINFKQAEKLAEKLMYKNNADLYGFQLD